MSSVVRINAALGWCALLILAGCGKSEPPLGPLVPVQGKITLMNGKPLPDGVVTFVALDRDPNPASAGDIGADGSYTLSTRGKPGAPEGKYRVVLTRGKDREAWLGVPNKYSSEKNSPLEVEVVENKPQGGYDLKVQSQAPKGPRRLPPVGERKAKGED
jgi:hypothetical protein